MKNKKNRAARAAFAMMGKYREEVGYTRQLPPTDPAWVPTQKRLVGDEVFLATWLVMMANSMGGAMGEKLRDRLDMLPRGWQRYRQATGIMLRLADDILCTLTSGQLYTMRNMDRHGVIRIELKNAAGTPDLAAIVRTNEMTTIAQAAQRGECELCVRDGGEIKGCPLRKAFDECGLAGAHYDEALGCLYRNKTIGIEDVILEH